MNNSAILNVTREMSSFFTLERLLWQHKVRYTLAKQVSWTSLLGFWEVFSFLPEKLIAVSFLDTFKADHLYMFVTNAWEHVG